MWLRVICDKKLKWEGFKSINESINQSLVLGTKTPEGGGEWNHFKYFA